MGLNNENAARLIFDIETCSLPEAKDYIEPAEAPGNYKDPAKIAAYIEEKNLQNLNECGLDVDLCRVVAIGWQREDADTPSVVTTNLSSEREIIEAFWMMATGRHLVGFGCLDFDLPVLLRRSLYLGIPTPRISIDKYRHPDVTDLMGELSYNGKLKWRGLAFYSKRFGFDVPDTMTGADVEKAVTDGRWADITAHVKADVTKTALLAAKLGYFNHVMAGVL